MTQMMAFAGTSYIIDTAEKITITLWAELHKKRVIGKQPLSNITTNYSFTALSFDKFYIKTVPCLQNK